MDFRYQVIGFVAVGFLAWLLFSLPSLAGAAEGDAMGRVVSVRGAVTAELSNGLRRPLACGDAVREGEMLNTAKDAALSIQTSDGVFTKIDSESALRVARADDGSARFFLQQGHLRVFSSSETFGIATPFETAQAVANDIEAYAGAPGSNGVASSLCSWGGMLDVNAAGSAAGLMAVSAGQCAVANPGQLLTLASGRPSDIRGGEELCFVEVAELLQATDVAADLPGRMDPPSADSANPIQPCDVAGCGEGVNQPEVVAVTPEPSDEGPGGTPSEPTTNESEVLTDQLPIDSDSDF